MLKKSLVNAPVIAVRTIAQNIFQLTLSAPNWAHQAHAGHFVNVEIMQGGVTMWRRPFSVHRVDRQQGTLDLLVAIVGRGSNALSTIKPGEHLNLIGLLGNTFAFNDKVEEAIIIAGGIGIAPFLLFLQDISQREIKTTVFYGAKTAKQLCCLEDLQGLASQVYICTEDGSAGERGLVTQAAQRYLSAAANTPGRALYTCGPTPMLKRVRDLSLEYGVSAQVSVENLMACGFGACVGCPVELQHPTLDGQKYLLACKDGPVFPLQEIIFHD